MTSLAAALCRVEGHPTWWDDEIHGEDPKARTARHEKAKEVCSRCPAVAACRDEFDPALDSGVWFGEVHDRRRATTSSHNTTAHLGARTRRTA